MNFLAHLFLAKDTPSSMLGNLMGDFVKGPVDGKFPREIAEGIVNHRRVDHFTDTHPVVLRSKKTISPERARYAGIIVDIVYDHFLCLNWNRFTNENLRAFIVKIYNNLSNRSVIIPERAARFIEWMIQVDLLASYASLDGIDKTFERVSKRLSIENRLDSAVEELETHYETLNNHFLLFFPQLMERFQPEKNFHKS